MRRWLPWVGILISAFLTITSVMNVIQYTELPALCYTVMITGGILTSYNTFKKCRCTDAYEAYQYNSCIISAASLMFAGALI